ncbi:MAG: hypothetical protein Q9219_001529 [cf. Caloplaca sp. 3 TL-2023]
MDASQTVASTSAAAALNLSAADLNQSPPGFPATPKKTAPLQIEASPTTAPFQDQPTTPHSDRNPSTPTPTPQTSPFLTNSIGFPRVIDTRAYSPSISPATPFTIPDLVVTVLYNYDCATGKKTLAAFLDFGNTEFCFLRREKVEEGMGLQFQIEREGDFVLCGHQIQPGFWQDYYVHRVETSGVWSWLPVDVGEMGLAVVHDPLKQENVEKFVADVLLNEKWIAGLPDAVIEVAVKHAI